MRWIFVALALVAGVWFGVSLFDAAGESVGSLLPLTLFLWAMLAIGSGSLLARLPPAIDSGDGLLSGLWKRLLIAGYVIAALASVSLLGFVAFLSLRVFGLVSE